MVYLMGRKHHLAQFKHCRGVTQGIKNENHSTFAHQGQEADEACPPE